MSEQAAGLSRQVSTDDKAKLDEYLTSVREVEKRIHHTRATKQHADGKQQVVAAMQQAQSTA